MSEKRPALPAALRRRVLLEAGHRCAIPTCKAGKVEVAHIVAWSKVREHAFENLIALCPTCHARYDDGEIDALSMREYKRRLSSDASAIQVMFRSLALNSYRKFVLAVDDLERCCNAVGIANVVEDADVDVAIASCTAAWRTSCDTLDKFTSLVDDATAEAAKSVHSHLKLFADEVVDGLYPSGHLGAREHDWERHYEGLEKLRVQVALLVQMDERQLTVFVAGDPGQCLGGTGRKF